MGEEGVEGSGVRIPEHLVRIGYPIRPPDLTRHGRCRLEDNLSFRIDPRSPVDLILLDHPVYSERFPAGSAERSLVGWGERFPEHSAARFRACVDYDRSEWPGPAPLPARLDRLDSGRAPSIPEGRAQILLGPRNRGAPAIEGRDDLNRESLVGCRDHSSRPDPASAQRAAWNSVKTAVEIKHSFPFSVPSFL